MADVTKLEQSLPVAPLKIIALDSAAELGSIINDYLVEFRKNTHKDLVSDPAFQGYRENNYLVDAECARFGSGEGKGRINESVRGKDLYILVDVCNHSITYSVNGYENHKSPDDHYQDLKRMIAAVAGKAHRITVIMPFLYESRQHKRNGRESLDCAYALEELSAMGVSNIVTFDAHDPRVQNAAPLCGFDNFMPTYQFTKALLSAQPDLKVDKEHTIVISPDEGALDRAIYFANVLGVDAGMFYKRRDHSVIIDGKNPISQHEYIGSPLDGKKILIVDDMIDSGESVVDIINQTVKYHPAKTYVCATFAFFSKGVEKFDKLYEEGRLTKLYTTNLSYVPDEIRNRPWFCEVDLSRFCAKIISTLNHDESISPLLDATFRFRKLLRNSQ